MEARKIEESYEVNSSRPKLEIVKDEPKQVKNMTLLMALTLCIPVLGWTYAKGVDGLFVSLIYIPLAFTLFVPGVGWAVFALFHFTMSYFLYTTMKRRSL